MSAAPRMEAGAAVETLSLPAGLPLAGYVAEGRTALSANAALSVRALVLVSGETCLVVVAFDLLYASAGLARRVRELVADRLGIASERVLVAGTHTHCAPRDTTTASDAELVESLAEQGRDAVVRAAAERVPVRIVSGTAENVSIGRSRRGGGDRVDSSAQLVVMQDEDDAVVATIVNYACHPVVLDEHARSYHPDYIGPLRLLVEEAVGGVALVLQGFAGDVNPTVIAHTERETSRVGARAAGPIIARIADMVGTERSPHVYDLSHRGEIPVDVPPGRVHHGPLAARSVLVPTRAREIAVPERPDALRTAVDMETWITDRLRARDPIFNSMEMAVDAGDPLTLEVQTLAVGDGLVLVAFPGEPLNALRAEVVARFPGARVLTIGYANGAPGYLPGRGAYEESGYEIGCSIVRPGTAEELVSAVPDPRDPLRGRP